MNKTVRFITCTCLCTVAWAGEDVAREAWQLRMNGRIDEAKTLLVRHVAKHPEDGPSRFELARIEFLTASEPRPPGMKASQEAIEAALKIDPDNAQYHFWAGTIALYQGIAKAHKATAILGLSGQMKRAIRHYGKALAINPDYHEARLALFGCYDRLPWALGGSRKKAKAELAAILERDPVYGAEAKCQKRPRKTNETKVAIWETCIRANPRRADAHARLAMLLARTTADMEGLTRAAEHAHRAYALDPRETYPFLVLARGYHRTGNLDKAEQAARLYLDCHPLAAQARAWGFEVLARVAEERGDTEQAEEYARKAGRLHPGGFRPKLPMNELFGAP